jgi:L-amino acid N-acyltransferase YncA
LPPSAVAIRPYEAGDWSAVADILRPIIRSGEYYTFDPETSDEEIEQIWIAAPQETYVAIEPESGRVVGTYYLKPNWPGLGSHVANAGYAVSEEAQGRGVASTMCEHSLHRARELGFRAMQFNFVVSTNERAVQLWRRHGFEIVGVLPEAFRHARLGYVDVFVMFRKL